eukprot:jgi/Mesen1/4280/ME000022S03569
MEAEALNAGQLIRTNSAPNNSRKKNGMSVESTKKGDGVYVDAKMPAGEGLAKAPAIVPGKDEKNTPKSDDSAGEKKVLTIDLPADQKKDIPVISKKKSFLFKKGDKLEKSPTGKHEKMFPFPKLFGTVDVRQTLENHRERRASLKHLEASNVIDSPEEESSPPSSKRETFHWEIDPRKLVIKKFLAKGTYGTVHRGTYDGKDVAVKLLDWGEDNMSRAELSELRNAFKQEVSVWSTLDHPNVTQFYGAIVGGSKGFDIPSTATGHDGRLLVDGHVCCVVLEYESGGNLKTLLNHNRNKKLPFKMVIQLALDAARGLAYLHSKHIVHRDVKSDNMLLDKYKHIKIADFGVSRVESSEGKECLPMAGTFGYMAPEILKGEPYDHKVDVYSFGIMLWEIYCCDNPFPFMNFNVNDIKAFVGQGLRPQVPACCPKELSSLMEKCWDQNPDKRPSMVEVAQTLQGLLSFKGQAMMRAPELVKPSGCFCFHA